MLATPFTFLRGSAAVMAADLAAGPRTDLTVQLEGVNRPRPLTTSSTSPWKSEPHPFSDFSAAFH
jgi:hypothetical protein